MSAARHAAWLAAACAGVFGYLIFLKYCQYRGFQLTQDTADTANLAYHWAFTRTLECSTLGVSNYLAVHFMPAVVLLAPMLLLWNDTRLLALAQSLALASIPAAAYLLAFRRTRSSFCGWAALWLVLTSPLFFNLVSANVALQVILPALFLWGVWLAETGHWRAAAACAVAMALTIEQTPILFFGLGLYAIARWGRRDRRALLGGAGVCLGAALLWFLELRLIGSFPATAVRHGGSFEHLAPTLPALLRRMAFEPLAVARAVMLPVSNLSPLWSLLASGGLLCLLAPWELMPALVNFLPNLLSTGYYHDLRLHYSAYVVGPFWWAMVMGLAWAYGRLERRKRTSWLLIFALVVGARNIYVGPKVLLRDWSRSLFSEGPVLIAMIPPTASVWATEYLTPWLACRRSLKILPRSADEATLSSLFVPDYVLLDRTWVAGAEPQFRDKLLTFLSREGYVKAAERSLLVLLRHPHAPRADSDARPAPLTLPAADASAAPYAALLARNDDLPATAALFRSLAEQGDEQAQADFGTLLYQGTGVAKDADEAMSWWLKAAAQGSANAQTSVGREYTLRGDWPRAVTWFGRAAAQGNAEAQYDLGIASSLGKGTLLDIDAGCRWFRRAAEQENAPAEYNLGVCLADREPPLGDPVEAARWLRRAAEHGQEKAKKKLADLEERLSRRAGSSAPG